MNTQTKFQLLETVAIKALEQNGIVERVMFDSVGTKYEVSYWFNGERKSVWCLDCELGEQY